MVRLARAELFDTSEVAILHVIGREKSLGIECVASTAALELVGKQMASRWLSPELPSNEPRKPLRLVRVPKLSTRRFELLSNHSRARWRTSSGLSVEAIAVMDRPSSLHG